MQSSDDYMKQKILNHILYSREHIRLFWPILGVGLLVCILSYSISSPEYTATAVIGPPNPSPTMGLISNATGMSLMAGSAARRLLGGSAGAGGNDPFQEFLELLTSPRLAQELTMKDKILPVVFSRQWDNAKNRWKENGPLFYVASGIKRLFNRPVSEHPDVEALTKFLNLSLKVDQAASYSASFLSTSGFMTVSIKMKDRYQAQAVLRTILKRANDLIREDQLRDVNSRIQYINSELPNITAAEQRATLIQILSSQEELKTMLVADQYFAIMIVTPPYAPIIPTSPSAPSKGLFLTFIGAIIVWFGVVELSLKFPWLERITSRFRRE